MSTNRNNSTTNLPMMSARELTDAYAGNQMSPVEVVQAALGRIARIQPVLNAFCWIDDEAALEDAKASETRWKNGAPLGPIDGVPTTVKDLILTRGWPTLRGSHTVSPNQPWDEDGPAVARLRESGAVLLGKTTTPEFAFKPVTSSPLTGITRNPWDPELTPGGSSGGAGASVAVGAGTLALATDAGGSIRIPSSFCGVFGMKPSGGRVPMHPPTPLASLVGFGPMTRTVDDAARMLTILARPDPRDSAALPFRDVNYHEKLDADPTLWRIAYSPTLGFARVDPEIAKITAEAAQAFAEMGAQVEEVTHIMDDQAPLMTRLRKGFTAYAFRHLTDDKFAIMDPAVVEEIRQSRGADLNMHFDAELARSDLLRQMIAFHATYDFLLTPTLCIPPFSANLDRPESETRYSWTGMCIPFNLTRQPAASVPCGFTSAGLPVGLQIVGPPRADLAVLQAARAFEMVHPWKQRRPELAV